MQISAIMNIHELATNRHVKQKPKGAGNEGQETACEITGKTEQEEQMMHPVQRIHVGEVTQKDEPMTGHTVNIVT